MSKLFISDLDMNAECGNCGEPWKEHVIAVHSFSLEIHTDEDLPCGPWETALNPVEEEPLPDPPEKIYVWEYLHGNNDEFSDWEMYLDENTSWDRNGPAAGKLHYRLYEVDVFLEVDLRTGEHRVMVVRYGGQTFYADDYDPETMKEFYA